MKFKLLGSTFCGIYLPALLALTLFSEVGVRDARANEPRTVKEVVAEGIGKDVAEASQNAAQNALRSVVGSFIDSNTMIERRVQIQDGIVRQTKNLSRDIKEYSQGVIQRFEVVDVQQGPLVRVTARVAVRIEDFRVYIQKLAEGSAAVGGLVTQLQTEQRQSSNGARLLHDNVLSPLAHSRGLVVELGAPIPFSQTPFARDGTYEYQFPLTRRHKISSIVGFEVFVSIDGAFRENMIRTLDSIATQRGTAQSRWNCMDGSLCYPDFYQIVGAPSPDALTIAIRQPIAKTLEQQIAAYRGGGPWSLNLKSGYTAYRLQGMNQELRSLSLIGRAYAEDSEHPEHRDVMARAAGKLVVSISDSAGRTLKTHEIDGRELEAAKRRNASGAGAWDIEIVPVSPTSGGKKRPPWVLIDSVKGVGTFIYLDNKFWVLLAIDPETMQTASKITAKILTN